MEAECERLTQKWAERGGSPNVNGGHDELSAVQGDEKMRFLERVVHQTTANRVTRTKGAELEK